MLVSYYVAKNLFQTLQQHDLAQIYLQYFKIVETNGYVHWTSLKVIQWRNVPEIRRYATKYFVNKKIVKITFYNFDY